MKLRLLSSIIVGAALVLGTTGCTMISNQATTMSYSPADGINVDMPGSPVSVNNVLLVADEQGVDGNLIAAVVNDTTEDQILFMEFGEGPGAILVELEVPAKSMVSLGATDTPILLEGIDTKPGADISVFFQSGDSDTVRAEIPVLDGSLPYLAPFVP